MIKPCLITFRAIAFPLLALLAFLPYKAFATTSCSIPGTATPCYRLVSELPWQFSIEEEGKENRRIFFKHLKGKRQAGIPLKISLDVNNFSDQKSAEASFSKINMGANPDTGISYGWDLVLLREKRLFHLHADCTLAEQHFESLVHALTKITSTPDNHTPHALLCRCGGGCKPFE